jgi:hypothetical protein
LLDTEKQKRQPMSIRLNGESADEEKTSSDATQSALRHASEIREIQAKYRAKGQTAAKMIRTWIRHCADMKREHAVGDADVAALHKAIHALKIKVRALSMDGGILRARERISTTRIDQLVEENMLLKRENVAHYDTVLGNVRLSGGTSAPHHDASSSSSSRSTSVETGSTPATAPSSDSGIRIDDQRLEPDVEIKTTVTTTTTPRMRPRMMPMLSVSSKLDSDNKQVGDTKQTSFESNLTKESDKWYVHEVVSWMYATNDDATAWQRSSDSDTLEKLYRDVGVCQQESLVNVVDRCINKRITSERHVHLETRADMVNTRCYQNECGHVYGATIGACRPISAHARFRYKRRDWRGIRVSDIAWNRMVFAFTNGADFQSFATDAVRRRRTDRRLFYTSHLVGSAAS